MIKKGLTKNLEETKIVQAQTGDKPDLPESPELDENLDETSEDTSGFLAKIKSFVAGIGSNLRLIIILAVVALGILFAVQNFNVISVRFAWMEIRIFQFLAILFAILLGFMIAKVQGLWSGRSDD